MNKVSLSNPPNPSFILLPHQQDSYFHFSCGLICLGTTQLIMLSTLTQTDYSKGSVYKNSLKQQDQITLQTVEYTFLTLHSIKVFLYVQLSLSVQSTYTNYL